jgi:hypothetical protein
MNKTPLIIIGAAVAAFVLGTFSSSYFKSDEGMKEAVKREGLPMRIVSVKENTRLYDLRAEYPQFDSADPAWNSEIQSYVTGRIADFKKTAEENWQARNATAPEGEAKKEFPDVPFIFSIAWSPEKLDEDSASFILRLEAFEGGANTRQEIKTFNYDFGKGKPIALADLFPEEGDGYLQKISKYARTVLISKLTADFEGGAPTDMIESGTEPTIENFENFTFTDQAVMFYFPKYQVAPGVAGEQKVVMPRVITRD